MADEDLAYFRPSYAQDYDEPSTYKGSDVEEVMSKSYAVSRRLYGLKNISAFVENKENHEVGFECEKISAVWILLVGLLL